ncbi:MAG TPA: hypothetical protein VLT45_02385 [Kofleriaceae bacterium]|nr:hypothetical protein [Kofleriaceae bacterium]
MTDDDREQLEATLRRAGQLERANAELAARNAALVEGTAAPMVAKPSRGGYVLAGTSILAGVVLAMIPGCELLAALGFMLPLFWVIAVGMLRLVQWAERKDLL